MEVALMHHLEIFQKASQQKKFFPQSDPDTDNILPPSSDLSSQLFSAYIIHILRTSFNVAS